jgi:hypothetical protein
MLNNIAALLDAGVAASTNSYESIMTTTVGAGGTSTITFSSIPSTYKHLQIRAMALRTTNPGMTMSINGDTTAANYPEHILYGDGSSAGAAFVNSGYAGYVWGINDQASSTAPAVAIIDILDYTNTNKYKTFRSLNGADKNGSGNITFSSGFNSAITAAITSISFSGNGANFNQYSSFALYGIKG